MTTKKIINIIAIDEANTTWLPSEGGELLSEKDSIGLSIGCTCINGVITQHIKDTLIDYKDEFSKATTVAAKILIIAKALNLSD
jgi:hypothetical protein